MVSWDYSLLHFFNVTMAHPAMDQFWLTITQLHKNLWMQWLGLPLILGLLLWRCRWRFWQPLVSVGLAVALADTLCYRVIKALVYRARPFNTPELSDWLRKVGEAHGASFPSNHTANVMAGAVVLAGFFPRARYMFYTLAALVALSRVSLGVHYPSDVLAGSILGAVCGVVVRQFVVRRWFVLNQTNQV